MVEKLSSFRDAEQGEGFDFKNVYEVVDFRLDGAMNIQCA